MRMFRLHLRFSSTGTRRTLACAVLFVLALLLRASFGGIYYEPILDDTVQYILYPTSVDYGALIAREGMFSSRPLAALTDLFVMGRMENLFFGITAVIPIWKRKSPLPEQSFITSIPAPKSQRLSLLCS
jgi:hypothetical protein